MKTILEKEETYGIQMAQIRGVVSRFIKTHRGHPIRRGRHAHASFFIDFESHRGIVDIQMELVNWDEMPDEISDDYPFWLGSIGTAGELQTEKQIYWELPFVAVSRHLNDFLVASWNFLSGLHESDFTSRLPAPSTNPDRLPNLGGPKMRDFLHAEEENEMRDRLARYKET